MEIDWQINFSKIKDRIQKMADYRFLVGTSSNQSSIAGHRLLMAMASPVFERMFYGNLPEKEDSIIIPDVQPDSFKSMLNYIYTDEISISSFDHACGLFYVAKKYMLPHVVENCTNFLLANLSPKNVYHAYEFGKLFEDRRLMESSMEHIILNTQEVIADASFMDMEFSTLMTILDQDCLDIDSELDLFNSLLKFANVHGIWNVGDEDNTTDAGSQNASDVVEEMEDSSSGAASTSAGTCSSVPNAAYEVVEVNSCATASGQTCESTANTNNIMDAQRNTVDEAMLRQAVKKIRFLTMTPQQFAEGPLGSKLLKQNEANVILINISSPTFNDYPMPEGFCQSGKRARDCAYHRKLKRYCLSPSRMVNIFTQFLGIGTCLSFKVDTNIHLLGIKLHHTRLPRFRNCMCQYRRN